MNFDHDENQTPRFTGMPEQNFELPRQEFYAQEVAEPYVKNIETPDSKNANIEQEFEEREVINWQAPDVIIGEKSKRWYLFFFCIVAILIGVSLWFQMWTFSALIFVASLAIMVTRHGSNQNTISYSLSTRGIYIGNIFHAYDEFRYFGIIQEASIYSIILIPKKRFSPSVSIFFDKQDGEKITDIIGQRLPMEKIKLDIIDRIIRKINL